MSRDKKRNKRKSKKNNGRVSKKVKFGILGVIVLGAVGTFFRVTDPQ